MFRDTIRDLRLGARTLARAPGFTLMAALALGLGIGANTAIFSVVNGVLLHALPYERPDGLVLIWEDATRRGGTNRVPVAPGNFHSWRASNPVFADMAALANASFRLTAVDQPLVPLTHRVTANYFDVLGVKPELGRTFVPSEGRTGHERVVVLSYGLWQRALGGDAAIVGTTLELDGESYTVIGVLRPDYLSIHQFAVQPGLFVPMVMEGLEEERRNRNLVVYGRLRDGVTADQAQVTMTTFAQRLEDAYPDTNADWRARVVPIREEAVGRIRPTLLVLLAAVGFVLLIACANVANLTLARATARQREIALRRSLGASGLHLVRQLLSESLLLGAIGGVAGSLLAMWALGPLLRFLPAAAPIPFLDAVTLDARVMLFTAAASVLTGVLFGLAPIHQAMRLRLSEPLRQGGRGALTSSTRRFGRALVVVEVALAMVLTAGAGLMIQSFRNLKGYEPGFDAERLLTVRNSLRGDAFREPSQRIAYFEELVRRLEAVAGVEAASATSFTPPVLPFRATTFRIPGEEVVEGHEPSATARAVSADYFRTLGIPVREGRALGTRDRPDSAPVVVVNEALVRQFFRDRDPVGATLSLESNPRPEIFMPGVERRIVGVVGDVRSSGTNPEPLPMIYFPHSQAPVPIMNLMVRTEGEPSDLLRTIERTAWEMGGDINVYGVETLESRIASLEWTSDVSTYLLSAFALLSLALGAAGIYGVLSYAVTRRRQEIGLRMAVGASAADMLRMVLREGLTLVAAGLVFGLFLSIALARVVESFLYDVTAYDVATFATVIVTIAVVATLACAVPAYRAARMDPTLALRQE